MAVGGEVGLDADWAVVESCVFELNAKLNDACFEGFVGCVWVCFWCGWFGVDGVKTTGTISGEESVDVLPGHLVCAGGFGDG